MSTNRHRRLRIESLESRTLLAADLTGGILTITGTGAADNIQVQVATSGPHNGQLQVDDNGVQSFFSPAQVDSIVIRGGKGNDFIDVDGNVNIPATIYGGKGNDTINGGNGFDNIYGDGGNDIIDGRGESDFIEGGRGNDSIHGGSDGDVIHGGAGNDSIWGDDGGDALRGNSGDDFVDGGDDPDVCHGSSGDDIVRGGDSEDEVWGDSGNDQLWGGDEGDYVDGGSGNDDCRGEDGDDEVKGDSGNDHLDGGAGNNLLDGDTGTNVLLNGLSCELESQVDGFLPSAGPHFGNARHGFVNDNGVLKREFRLEVYDMAANSVFDVVVNGVTVGQITTDGSGDAVLHYSTLPSNGQIVLPSIFPDVFEGSTLSVGTILNGSFVHHFEVP